MCAHEIERPAESTAPTPDTIPGLGEKIARLLLAYWPLGPLVRRVARIRASVHSKLLVAFLMIALLFIAMAAMSLQTIASVSRHSRLLDQARERVDAAREIENALSIQMDSTKNALLLRDEAALESILRQKNRLDATIGLLEREGPPGERETILRIRETQDKVMATVADMTALIRAGQADDAMALHLNEGYPLQRDMVTLVTQAVRNEETGMGRLRGDVEATYRRALFLMAGFGAASIFLALGLGFVISWSFILPVREAEGFLGQVAKGNFGATIDVANRDEFGALADRMNQMSRELHHLYEEHRVAAHQLRELNAELERASKAKSDFLANMSHELRTPLNAIIGFSEVLSERMFGELNEKQEEYMKDIHASGTHLLSLINDILDLSKIEAGRMELEETDFDLPAAIDSAVTLVRERAARRGITLGTAVGEGVGEVRGDERKIRQVALNLLSNAIKFTPEGGRIEVAAVPNDGSVEVSVSDTGVGIAPEDHEAVFEEFRQVGASAAKQEGTGLGLALARKFIELHGGKIWVTSQVGAGSTFTFTLPLQSSKG
jgi:signal transduction histidine kinase